MFFFFSFISYPGCSCGTNNNTFDCLSIHSQWQRCVKHFDNEKQHHLILMFFVCISSSMQTLTSWTSQRHVRSSSLIRMICWTSNLSSHQMRYQCHVEATLSLFAGCLIEWLCEGFFKFIPKMIFKLLIDFFFSTEWPSCMFC